MIGERKRSRLDVVIMVVVKVGLEGRGLDWMDGLRKVVGWRLETTWSPAQLRWKEFRMRSAEKEVIQGQ